LGVGRANEWGCSKKYSSARWLSELSPLIRRMDLIKTCKRRSDSICAAHPLSDPHRVRRLPCMLPRAGGKLHNRGDPHQAAPADPAPLPTLLLNRHQPSFPVAGGARNRRREHPKRLMVLPPPPRAPGFPNLHQVTLEASPT
jgi:hypothetical protein